MDLLTKESNRVNQLVGQITKASSEQAAATTQIAAAMENIRVNTDQINRAMGEQAQAAQEISTATRDITRQISMIARLNKEQTDSANYLVNALYKLESRLNPPAARSSRRNARE